MSVISDFFTRFNELSEAASATPDGRAFTAAGFKLHHNGGGCTAWRKDFGSFEVLISDSEGCSHDLDGEADFYLVGRHHYDSNGHYDDSPVESREAKDAVAAIGAVFDLVCDGKDEAEQRAIVGKAYAALVGYDPFDDDPTTTIKSVVQTYGEVIAERTLERRAEPC